jgi:hypothetical protein
MHRVTIPLVRLSIKLMLFGPLAVIEPVEQPPQQQFLLVPQCGFGILGIDSVPSKLKDPPEDSKGTQARASRRWWYDSLVVDRATRV